MMRFLSILTILLVISKAPAEEVVDPAFDSPAPDSAAWTGIQWNTGIGLSVANKKLWQQFVLRPVYTYDNWAVGLDFTFRFDEDGVLKDDEWDDGWDAVEKIYFISHGIPGDPLYFRLGSVENATLGYGLILRQYSNTIQYPAVKRTGGYVEGGWKSLSWQGLFNNARELPDPGLLAARLSLKTPLKSLAFGATIAHDGNQFAGLQDPDNDGVPDGLDLFDGVNDFQRRQQLFDLLSDSQIRELIESGNLPNILHEPVSYNDIKESVTIFGADADFPLIKGRPVSLKTYAQAAKIVDFGWAWAFPGLRLVAGPIEIGGEYRQYDKQFRGEFFDFSYELSRARVVGDTIMASKESTLSSLGKATGYSANLLITPSSYGYLYVWHTEMEGINYPRSQSLYAEAAVTPGPKSLVKKIAGYYYEPNSDPLFKKDRDGKIYGGKLFFGLSEDVSIIYDHQLLITLGERQRIIRIEAMIQL